MLRDRHDHAAAGRAVELGENDPGAAGGLLEALGLREGILAGGGIDDEEHFMGRFRDELRDHAADLGELLHEIRLRLEAAGGIDDADVGARLDRPRDRLVGDAGRIAPLRAADDLGAEPVGPHRELLDGRRSEGVAGPKHDALAFAGEDPRELRDRRRLPRAVDAGDEDHG